MKRIPVRSVGADKGYHAKEFIRYLRKKSIQPHVAAVTGRKAPELDWRTFRHESYRVSIRKRKRVEKIFGWMKTVGQFRRTRYKGIAHAVKCTGG